MGERRLIGVSQGVVLRPEYLYPPRVPLVYKATPSLTHTKIKIIFINILEIKAGDYM